jgi:uncharacterized alpha-E superfamily protein
MLTTPQTTLDPTPQVIARPPTSPVASVKPFLLNQPPKPMLAREADSMYWMARYVERAEHTARLLLVNANTLIDVGDLDVSMQDQQWQSILTILRLPQLSVGENGDAPLAIRVARTLAYDLDNANSIASCIGRARENARGIRENISAEMWEQLNGLYWSIRAEDAQSKFEESPDDFYRFIMTGSMLFQGLTDQTLGHEQRWQFTQLAKYFERVDITCRVIQTKYNLYQELDPSDESAVRNVMWSSALRQCCSIETYRKHFLGDMDPLKVSAFLLLEKDFPRTVRFGVRAAYAAISAIRGGINPNGTDAAERILGRLDAQLEYAEVSEFLAEGLPQYLDRIQTAIADASIAVQKAYFLH